MRSWSLRADDERSKGELRRTPNIAPPTRAGPDLRALFGLRLGNWVRAAGAHDRRALYLYARGIWEPNMR